MTREDLILALHNPDRPDRELDVLLALFIDFKGEGGIDDRQANDERGFLQLVAHAEEHQTALPLWTTSVDAAISLARQLAPGRSIELGEYVPSDRDDGPAGCYANVDTYCMGDGPRWEGGAPAPTLARAVVIAALEEAGRAETPEAPPAGPIRFSEGVQARMSAMVDATLTHPSAHQMTFQLVDAATGEVLAYRFGPGELVAPRAIGLAKLVVKDTAGVAIAEEAVGPMVADQGVGCDLITTPSPA